MAFDFNTFGTPAKQPAQAFSPKTAPKPATQPSQSGGFSFDTFGEPAESVVTAQQQDSRTFSQKTGDVLDTVFGGKKIGERIGTGIAKAFAKPEERQYIEAGPSNREVIGDVARVGVNFLPVGRAATAATRGAQALGVASRFAKPLGNIAAGALTGYAGDVAVKTAEGKTGAEAFKPGFGTAFGAAIPTIPLATRAAGRMAGEAAGIATGAGYGPVKQMFEAGRRGGEALEAATGAMRGRVQPDEIVSEARDALGMVKKARTETYADNLASVKANPKQFEDVKPVIDKFNTMLGEFGVEVGPKGPDFSRSPGLGRYKTHLKDLSDVIASWGTKEGDLTTAGMDKLKQVIDDFRIGSADSKKFDAFVTALRNEAKGMGLGDKNYQKMLGSFSEASTFIDETKRGLSLGDKAQADTAFRKLTGVLRTNNEFRKALAEELNELSGGTLIPKIAGQQMSEIVPRGLAKYAAGVGATQIGIGPGLLSLLGTSPRLVGEAARALGIGARGADVLMNMIVKTGSAGNKIVSPGDVIAETSFGKKVANEAKDFIKRPKIGMGIEDVSKTGAVYEGEKDLTLKTLEKLKGRSTVSKQFISDLTNAPDLKQPERDAIRAALADEGDNVSVKEFANKVKTELLPLKRTAPGNGFTRYENIVLPQESRGTIAAYKEHIYQSPIKTTAGGTHFSHFEEKAREGYFAHARVEDLPGPQTGQAFGKKGLPANLAEARGEGGSTRRVIEIQSDLFQKGRLENEAKERAARAFQRGQRSADNPMVLRPEDVDISDLKKLEPYRNTWHERIIKEEVKQAALDGKTKLQFPTGETAMKIEGLDNVNPWVEMGGSVDEYDAIPVTGDSLKVGQKINRMVNDVTPGNDWVVTEVVGGGRFKAVPATELEKISPDPATAMRKLRAMRDVKTGEPGDWLSRMSENFDLNKNIDSENPIHKFYEKEVGRYLKNKYGAELITDPQGVKWWQVDVSKKPYGKMPVEAFGAVPLLDTIKDKVKSFGKVTYQRKEEEKPVSKTITVKDRNIPINRSDLDMAVKVLFAELSNKGSIEERKEEGRKILNTALNRMKESGETLLQVLTKKNQYQGFGSKQFKKIAMEGPHDVPTSKKLDLVRQIIAELESGDFADNTQGNVSYIHNPDGSLKLEPTKGYIKPRNKPGFGKKLN